MSKNKKSTEKEIDQTANKLMRITQVLDKELKGYKCDKGKVSYDRAGVGFVRRLLGLRRGRKVGKSKKVS